MQTFLLSFQAIEKFSASTSQIGQRLREVCQKLQLTEFPNDVPSTESLIGEHDQKRTELKDDLLMTIKHGEILLGCIKTVRNEAGQEVELSSNELPCNKLAHITAVERLLVQLEETLHNFEDFWQHHEHKLQQCLQLRRFEETFRQVATLVDGHIAALHEKNEFGDSPESADQLLRELDQFETETMEDIQRTEALRQEGEKFIEEDHYAVDCIRPKCLELQRICEQYKELLRKRQELLAQSRALQDRILRANHWCSRGIDLMASQSIDQNSPQEAVLAALREIDAFMNSEDDLGLSNPTQVKVTFDEVITPELKVALEQVLQRMDDVRTMCDQKRQSLHRIVDRPLRPVQTVYPEPKQIQGLERQCSEDLNYNNKHRDLGRSQLERSKTDIHIIDPEWELPHIPKALDSDSDSGSSKDIIDVDNLQAKQKRKRKMQRHVMRELIETEKVYVSELKTILEGYADQMDNPALRDLIPSTLQGQQNIIFGNLREIYEFHESMFLKELEACRDTPALVGKCFACRKEEFRLYSDYCKNKVASDDLRQEVGDDNPFFKECQNRCGHKLPLGAYLLKPVQRLTKYQLLLKEMVKYTQCGESVTELEEAVETMLSVLKYVNDMMHQVAITGYDQDKLSAAGRLLMQGSFSVWRENKKIGIRDLRFKPMQRHIFLYEKLVLFCKRKEEPDRADKASYIYKHSLQTSQIGLTERVRGDKKKFEIWLHGRSEVYTIQAPSIEVKNTWVAEIKKVLLGQFDEIRETFKKTKTSPLSSSPVQERVLESSQSVTLGATVPFSTENNNMPSPKGLRKSYSTDSYTTLPSLPKSLSTDAALVSDSNAVNKDSTADLNAEPEEDNWSTDEEDNIPSSNHLGNHDNVHLDFQDIICTQRYIALASYEATECSEATIQEGDMCEILQIGSKGWWFIRNLATMKEGWVPASFLDCAKRSSTYSAQSTLSSGSTDSGGRRNGSLTSSLGTSAIAMSMTSKRHSISSESTSTSGISTQSSTSNSTHGNTVTTKQSSALASVHSSRTVSVQNSSLVDDVLNSTTISLQDGVTEGTQSSLTIGSKTVFISETLV